MLNKSQCQWLIAEEVPVTFQVGIVATDGVILASDTRLTNTTGIRTLSTTDKIICLDNPRMAYCWCGDLLQGNAAELFAVSSKDTILESTEIRTQLYQAGSRCIHQIYGDGPMQPASQRPLHTGGAALIAYIGKISVELWRLDITHFAVACPVRDKTSVGDALNPGIFLWKITIGQLH